MLILASKDDVSERVVVRYLILGIYCIVIGRSLSLLVWWRSKVIWSHQSPDCKNFVKIRSHGQKNWISCCLRGRWILGRKTLEFFWWRSRLISGYWMLIGEPSFDFFLRRITELSGFLVHFKFMWIIFMRFAFSLVWNGAFTNWIKVVAFKAFRLSNWEAQGSVPGPGKIVRGVLHQRAACGVSTWKNM